MPRRGGDLQACAASDGARGGDHARPPSVPPAALLGLGAAGLGVPALAHAQAGDYPNRPIKIIVPFAAGGGPDILTRKMAIKLAEVLGKGTVVVVDNIVGAGGILAAQNVARMAPDGYTLLLGASSHLVQKAMQPSVKFDPMKDFAHITRTAFTPSVLVVSADVRRTRRWRTSSRPRRSEPGKLNYASGGVGSAAHLCAAAMALQAKIDVVHVPYKGSVEIVPSILSGRDAVRVPDRLDRDPADPGRQGARAGRHERAAHAGAARRADAGRGVQDAGPRARRLVRPVGAGRHAAGDRGHAVQGGRQDATTIRHCAPTARRPAPSSRSALRRPSSRSSWKPRP